MTLSLAMLRAPAGITPESRRIEADTVTLGRGSDNGWVLADPERILSKRHCLIGRQAGAWQVTDTSRNGTFVNGACLSPGAARALRDGDRIGLGAYEIEIRIEEGAAPASDEATGIGPGFARVTADPFPPAEGDAFGIGLPQDFNQLGQDGVFGDAPLPVADHVPALDAHFDPPRPVSELLPPDWDLGWDAPADDMADDTAGGPPPPAPVPAPEAPADAPGDSAAAAFARVAAAAGIAGEPTLPPAEALSALGRAFRAMVVGLRRAMIARATIKNEFRIEQTMIRASGNNPLKFAAGDDDAVSALLGIGRRGDMSAERAVNEALRDIRRHDLAVSAAMQVAVREMLDSLDPARVLARLPPGGLDRVPGQRHRRAWQAMAARHAELTRALADDFDSVFGRAFVRAYEQVQAGIAAQEHERSQREEQAP
ncbi:Type VI secretion system-associated FHA domain protein TagH [Rhodovastum atsumiense]|uniref:Type VI secretion system-associated FHA domain protein TagH n=1 Tax=Rhodovastum atsumiense TaxID=504468 RepID=A0A5M6IZD7_9PROT|nr:type VI secretion system-associated FHA domain protein TagH [Rhodovastum atsumiense]KAA5612718.1 type VI secretion system-associated FHA domain protein TagH [Rhodovastum atsumiense]CAH2602728.1 Type VI secretion system-associated FHA domain protein TagH [Rhodovastum atsumiense]